MFIFRGRKQTSLHPLAQSITCISPNNPSATEESNAEFCCSVGARQDLGQINVPGGKEWVQYRKKMEMMQDQQKSLLVK